MFPLLLVGGTFVVGFVGMLGTASAVKIVSRFIKNDKEDNPRNKKLIEKGSRKLKDRSKKRNIKIDKKDVLSKLEEYKKHINSGVDEQGKTLDQLIENKIKSLNINPNTKRSKEIVFKVLKNSWGNILKAVNKKTDALIQEVEHSSDYEDVVSRIPKFDYSWIDSKASEVLVDKTMKKYSKYYSEIGDIYKSLSRFKDNKDSYVLKSLAYIKEIVDSVENKIISSEISEEWFEMDLKRALSDINAEISRMDQGFSLVSDVGNLMSLEEKVISNSNYLKNLRDNELLDLKKSIEFLLQENKLNNKQIENLWKNLASEIAARSKAIEEVSLDVNKTLLFIKNNVAKKKDINSIVDRIKDIDNKLNELRTNDLIQLCKGLEELKKDFNQVDDSFGKVVDEKISNLEARVRDFAKRSIAIRLGKKMKDFEEKTLDMIANQLLEQLKLSKEFTDEEIDNIVDKIIEKIKISKKYS